LDALAQKRPDLGVSQQERLHLLAQSRIASAGITQKRLPGARGSRFPRPREKLFYEFFARHDINFSPAPPAPPTVGLSFLCGIPSKIPSVILRIFLPELSFSFTMLLNMELARCYRRFRKP